MQRLKTLPTFLTGSYRSVHLKEVRDNGNTQFASQKAATAALESLGGEMAELAEHHRVIEVCRLLSKEDNLNIC